MQLEQLRVELRPRSAWEATELGMALVRANARAIWGPWCLATLPVFVLLNALGWMFGIAGAMGVVMWWLKPVFDRVPLYVLSRAVFGDAPSTRETLRAQWRWGWRAMPAYLLWRRLGARALYLPVDLLEGGAQPAQRRRVIGAPVYGTAALLTLVCANFELALVLGAYALFALFAPTEFLSEHARAAWALLAVHPPQWMHVAGNAVLWLATSLIEPFYIGAGFGLYLDRRTQLEAWDIEIAFRRMRERLLGALPVLALVGTLALATGGLARAQTTDTSAAPATSQRQQAQEQQAKKRLAQRQQAQEHQIRVTKLTEIFPHVENTASFDKAVDAAYADPLLSPTLKQTLWVARDKPKPKNVTPLRGLDALIAALSKVFGLIANYGLWGLVAAAVVALVWTRRRWWPWLRSLGAEPTPREDAAAIVDAHVAPDALPRDIAAAARALWRDGRKRRALALLYRASVEAMTTRTGAVLVPGATEADCLRAARGLRDADDRDAFARVVRVWQYAAYAHRLPGADDFEALVDELAMRFRWTA